MDNDQLRVRIHESDYHADIVMPPTEKDTIKITGTKRYDVGRNVSTGNSITSNTLTLTENHSLLNGETIRVISDNARLPDGLDSGSIYYSITSGVNADQLKIAKTYNDAVLGEALTINNLGGTLTLRVVFPIRILDLSDTQFSLMTLLISGSSQLRKVQPITQFTTRLLVLELLFLVNPPQELCLRELLTQDH